jgi:hypothetical protein
VPGQTVAEQAVHEPQTVTLGYGYQPWRALLFLAGPVTLSSVLAVANMPGS